MKDKVLKVFRDNWCGISDDYRKLVSDIKEIVMEKMDNDYLEKDTALNILDCPYADDVHWMVNQNGKPLMDMYDEYCTWVVNHVQIKRVNGVLRGYYHE